HREWQARRERAVAQGSQPSLRIETATARSMAQPEGPPAQILVVEGRDPGRPRGKRFGSLIHAVLAEVPLGAARPDIDRLAEVHGRRSGAEKAEVAAAAG